MFVLKKLYAENFRSYKKLELDNIDQLGLTLIEGINGSGKCIESDSYLYHDNILKPICSLHSDWNFNEFEEAELNISTTKGRIKKTSHLYNENVNKVVRLTTNYGFSIGGTENHKLLVINKDCDFEFKSLSQIKEGDFICIDRSQNLFPKMYPSINYKQADCSICCKGIDFEAPNALTEDLAILLGYYIANGTYYKPKDRVSISTINPILIKDIQSIASNISTDISLQRHKGKTKGISIGGVWFARFLKYLLDGNTKTARYKTVPSIILKSPKNCQAGFLRSLIDCDGYYSNNGSILEYYTASEKLAKMVHLMLLNFGIVSNLSFDTSAKVGDKIYNHNYYTISIGSSDIDIYFDKIGSLIYKKIEKTRNTNEDIIPYLKKLVDTEVKRVKAKLGVNKAGSFYKDSKNIRFIKSALIQSAAINITYEKLKNFLFNLKQRNDIFEVFDPEFIKICNALIHYNFYFDRVTSLVYEVKKSKVYDLTVPDTHCFYANGFINHNSSIRHLIEYLFTDTTSESISLDELTFDSQGDCKMECVIEDDKGTEIIITKYREHKKYDNKTFLTIDGDSDTHTFTDRRETQKEIEKLLDTNSKILSVSTIFSQFSDSFPELKESDRKKIIYDVKDLNKYQKYQEKAKDKKTELGNKLAKNEQNLLKCKELIDEYNSDLDIQVTEAQNFEDSRIQDLNTLQDREFDFATELKNIKEVTISLRKQLESLKLNLNPYYDKEKVQVFDSEQNNLGIQIHDFGLRLKEIFRLTSEKDELKYIDFSEYEEKIKEFTDLLISIDEEELSNLELYITKLEKSKIQLESEIKFLEQKLSEAGDGTCPVLKVGCDRLVEKNEEINSTYQSKLNDFLKQLEEFNEDLDHKLTRKAKIERDILGNTYNNKNIDRCRQEIDLIKKGNQFVDSRKNEIIELIGSDTEEKINLLIKEKELEQLNVINKKKEFDSIIEENDKIEKEINNTNYLITSSEEKENSLNNSIIDITVQINDKKKAENPHYKLRDRIIEKLDRNKIEVKNINTKMKKIVEDIKYYTFWEKGYSKAGIPNLKIDSFLEEIEVKTNKFLSQLSNEMSVQIDSQANLKNKEVREKISYKILSSSSKISDFFSFSGGQRQRVVLSDKLAFNTLLGNFDFVILDEVLELSLDQNGKDAIMDFLRRKVDEIGSIFVVSHDSSIASRFSSVFSIEINDGVSSIKRR